MVKSDGSLIGIKDDFDCGSAENVSTGSRELARNHLIHHYMNHARCFSDIKNNVEYAVRDAAVAISGVVSVHFYGVVSVLFSSVVSLLPSSVVSVLFTGVVGVLFSSCA